MGDFVAMDNLILISFVTLAIRRKIGLLLLKHRAGCLGFRSGLSGRGVKRSMNLRQFILALGLYTPEEMGNALFEPFCESCFRNRPKNYNPAKHSGKEKVTLDDLFLLHSMDGGARVDVLWHVAKFFTNKTKGYKKKSLIIGAHLIGRIARSYGLMTLRSLRNVTLGQETSLLNVAKMVDLGIYRYNGLGYGELVNDIPDNDKDEGPTYARDDDKEGVRRCPNISFTNRLRAMYKRLGEIETNIYKLGSDVDDLTYVVSGMSEQYDQFYEEFRQIRMEQERFQN
uniref:Uncharacterized protein n=1 Tax=Tanacetum cinerariifolium TaxID=118510 RepID=A0A699JAS4_TANCI|nr:hypothetical protein [Tanacetum cinerariifolium]